MAKDDRTPENRLIDWLILAFVVVVMILLAVELGTTVFDQIGSPQVPATTTSGQ